MRAKTNVVGGAVVALALCLGGCGSAPEASLPDETTAVGDWKIDAAEDGPTDHRPVCRGIDSRGEGWAWADTGELIRFERCAGSGAAHCGAVGTRSEGWFAASGFIVWDDCHRFEGIALAGESCGVDSWLTCFHDLFCSGDGQVAGSCQPFGTCLAEADCADPDNLWSHARCIGRAECQDGACVWLCEPPAEPRWGWASVLVRDLESDHPYGNWTERAWSQTFAGAARLQAHFSRLETEPDYDFVFVGTAGADRQVAYDGSFQDMWSAEVEGDTLVVELVSDYSVTGWGFAVDAVRFYGPLPEGTCSEDAHCAADETCVPHQCFNPYAPCYGSCQKSADGVAETDFEAAPAAAIPDDDPAGLISELSVSNLPQCQLRLEVEVHVRHTYIGDLVVGLTEPGGQRVVLHDRAGGTADDLHLVGLDWPVPFTKEGTWILDVSDRAALDVGTLETWALHFSCLD